MSSNIRRRLADTGVYYGWVVAAMCFTALLGVYAINFSFGVFFDFITSDLGSSRARTSLVFSLQTISLYISAAVVGNVVGHYSTRPLVLSGAGLLGIGMVGASQSKTLLGLYVSYGLVAGTGMGVIYVIAFSTAARWFDRRRGIATAIATSGVGVATLIAPPIASRLIGQIGWKPTYLVFTIVIVGALVVVAALIADDPRSMGIDAAHEFGNTPPGQVTTPGWHEQFRATMALVTKPSFRLVLLAWTTIYLPVFTILVYLVTYATDVGLARWVGVWSLSVLGGMTIPGRIGFGAVADHVGRTRSFVVLTAALGLTLLALPFIRVPALLLAFGGVYGLLYGGASALVSPLIADFYGAEHVTAMYGISALAFGVAALAGPYLAGRTFAVLGSYSPFLVGSAAASLVGTGCIVLAGRRERALEETVR